MKELFLLRSAQTRNFSLVTSDYSSKLNHDGYLQATTVGKYIYDHNIYIEKVYCSTAKRAIHTAVLAKSVGDIACPTVYEERLYGINLIKILKLIAEFEDKHSSILLVGHNPGFEALAHFLTNRTVELEHSNLIQINLPTNSWKDIETVKGTLGFLLKSDINLLNTASVVFGEFQPQV
jgi:phosphohistidine phosphatase